MKKTIYTNITLSCTMQHDEFAESECLHGVISKQADGFRFEEAVKQNNPRRNPKLFNGKYCSLVHMQNGRYQIHMRTIDASAVSKPNDFAFRVYSELLDAFNVIN